LIGQCFQVRLVLKLRGDLRFEKLVEESKKPMAVK